MSPPDQPKPISEEELKEMERAIGSDPWWADDRSVLAGAHEADIGEVAHAACPEMAVTLAKLPRLIAEVRRLKDALGMYGMPACWRDVFQHGIGYSAFTPPHPDYRNEPGWVLARQALGWSEPSEPCENPSCDGHKGEETFGTEHRCFKDGRWLDDGSEM